MKKFNLIITAGLFLLLGSPLRAQHLRACLEEVLSYEKLNSPFNDTLLYEKNIFMSYMVKATGWDNETNVSNIKMYRQKENLNFFSEQVNIYQDNKDVYIVLPAQKVIIASSTVKGANRSINDEFLEMRREFLDSCEIVKCEEINPNNKNKILVLKNRLNEFDDLIKIKSMTYEYNPDSKKIISVKIEYNEDYKLKQLVMIYKDISLESNHEFIPVRRVVTDKKGNLLAKYREYELIDNRDQRPGSKRPR